MLPKEFLLSQFNKEVINSKEYNFAHETKGSSPTHNAKLIPILMSIFFLVILFE